jgi:hypothetical protein
LASPISAGGRYRERRTTKLEAPSMTWKSAAFFLAVPLAFIGASIWFIDAKSQVFWGVLIGLVLLFGGLLFENLARRDMRPYWSIGVATWASAAVVISVIVYQWPLHVAYRLSQPAIERVADNIRAGRPFRGPARVGVFLIEQAEVSPKGVTCLWLNNALHSRTGLVQCSPVKPPFNLWSMTSLDERWQCITED